MHRPKGDSHSHRQPLVRWSLCFGPHSENLEVTSNRVLYACIITLFYLYVILLPCLLSRSVVFNTAVYVTRPPARTTSGLLATRATPTHAVSAKHASATDNNCQTHSPVRVPSFHTWLSFFPSSHLGFCHFPRDLSYSFFFPSTSW